MSTTATKPSAPKTNEECGDEQDPKVEGMTEQMKKNAISETLEAICSHVPANRMGYGSVTIFKDPPVTMVVQQTGYACTTFRAQRCAALLAMVQARVVNEECKLGLKVYTNGQYTQIETKLNKTEEPPGAFMRAAWKQAKGRKLACISVAKDRVPVRWVPTHRDAVDVACLGHAYTSSQMIVERVGFDPTLESNQQIVDLDTLVKTLLYVTYGAAMNDVGYNGEDDGESKEGEVGEVEGDEDEGNRAEDKGKGIEITNDIDASYSRPSHSILVLTPPADIYAFCATRFRCDTNKSGSGTKFISDPNKNKSGSGCVLLVPSKTWQQRATRENGEQRPGVRACLHAALLAVAHANQIDPTRTSKLHVFMYNENNEIPIPIPIPIQTLLVNPPDEDTKDLITEINDLSRRRPVYWQPDRHQLEARDQINYDTNMTYARATARRAFLRRGNETGIAVAVRRGYE